MPAAVNRHATAVVVGERGILILGPSGSGKSRLALALLGHARGHGLFARLVADDQVYLAAAGGRLLAAAPAPIAGLVEVRGAGPVPLMHQPRAVIDLAVSLVPAAEAPRVPEPGRMALAGVDVPHLALAERDAGAATAVFAALGLAPFCRASIV